MEWVAGGEGSCLGYVGIVGWWEFGIACRAYCFVRESVIVVCVVCYVEILYLFYEPG